MLDGMRLLAPFDCRVLDLDPAPICGLDADLRITYVNPAWCRFGRDNGGTWSEASWRGVDLLAVIPPILRPAYEDLFARARSTGANVEHCYECSSPVAFRRFQMRILPCERHQFVVVHALSQETPHTQPVSPAIEALYRDADGILTQCSHCHRVRRCDARAEQWDWVPDYAARTPPDTSHGLCRVCVAYFYPGYK